MNMRSVIDPYGGNDTLVDKLIGPTAFRVVQFVALKMETIERAAAFARLRATVTAVMSAPTVLIPYPAKIEMEGVVRSDVWLLQADKKIDPSSGLFRAVHTKDGIQLSILVDPITEEWLDTKIEWFIEANEVA